MQHRLQDQIVIRHGEGEDAIEVMVRTPLHRAANLAYALKMVVAIAFGIPICPELKPIQIARRDEICPDNEAAGIAAAQDRRRTCSIRYWLQRAAPCYG